MARRRKKRLPQPDTEMDLTPMIDVIFLLIIFFILAGKITADISNEQIVVPPTKTAEKWEKDGDWQHVKIEVRGNTQEHVGGGTPGHEIKMGLNDPWYAKGSTEEEGAFDAYQAMRRELDNVYARAGYYADPKTGIQLPKVVLELRADADTEYRVVQEIQQVATDSVDPFKKMTPKDHSANPAGMKAFVNFQFTTRLPGE